jgi:LytS/YehU family sensor histidine kinase
LLKVNDKGFRIAAIVTLSAIALFISEPSTDKITWTGLKHAILTIFMLILIWEGNRFLIFYSHRKFSPPYKTLKRFTFLVPACILFTSIIMVLAKNGRYYLDHNEWKFVTDTTSHLYVNNKQVTMGPFGPTIFNAVLITLFFFCFYEAFYYLVRMRNMEQEKEALQIQKNQSELHSLKQQVNPHFLFNSLNSLSSLISDDPEKAEKFLDEMSKVYRYMLRSNEDGLTSLDQEMLFIQSYFHMLKTRYGDGLEMHILIEDHFLEYKLPPFTLQMLVENAVKHNMILKQNPLQISIKTVGNGKLIVSNNLQRKINRVESTKVGLNNIIKKYQLMKHEAISIMDDGKEFAVTVPLIAP